MLGNVYGTGNLSNVNAKEISFKFVLCISLTEVFSESLLSDYIGCCISQDLMCTFSLKMHKSGVLKKAIDYIKYLQQTNHKLRQENLALKMANQKNSKFLCLTVSCDVLGPLMGPI